MGFAWDLAQGFVIIVVIVFRTCLYRLSQIKVRNFITEQYIILKKKTEVCLPCFCDLLSQILQIKIYSPGWSQTQDTPEGRCYRSVLISGFALYIL